MRKLAILPVAFALVAVSFYGCDETMPTGPEAAGSSFAFSGARRSVSSNFDVDSDDWTIAGDANGASGFGPEAAIGYSVYPDHDPAAGTPGGAIFATDDSRGIDWNWQAPPKFLGNRLGAYGGSIEFDRKQASTDNQFNGVRPDVILAGGGLTLVIDPCPNPGTNWTYCTVPLTADAGWKVGQLVVGAGATEDEIKRVLKHLTVLRIQGEFRYGPDTGWLDNVRILPRGQQ
jgi:hypothetical protein